MPRDNNSERVAVGEKEALADTKLELQLVGRHNIGTVRSQIEADLASALQQEYGTWRKMPFAQLLEQFESWLDGALTARLASISASHRSDLLKPQTSARRSTPGYASAASVPRSPIGMDDGTLRRAIANHGNRDRARVPKAPDVKIGRMFDHNWELLSPMLPMAVLRRPVKARFLRKISNETFKNLSRLTTQWADIVSTAILQMQREAEHRLEDLVQTVEHLTAASTVQAPAIRSGLGSRGSGSNGTATVSTSDFVWETRGRI